MGQIEMSDSGKSLLTGNSLEKIMEETFGSVF